MLPPRSPRRGGRCSPPFRRESERKRRCRSRCAPVPSTGILQSQNVYEADRRSKDRRPRFDRSERSAAPVVYGDLAAHSSGEIEKWIPIRHSGSAFKAVEYGDRILRNFREVVSCRHFHKRRLEQSTMPSACIKTSAQGSSSATVAVRTLPERGREHCSPRARASLCSATKACPRSMTHPTAYGRCAVQAGSSNFSRASFCASAISSGLTVPERAP